MYPHDPPAGRRVLELGCGAGLVGVALQRVGAQLAALTDGSAAAVHNCAANLRLNGIGGAAVVVQSGGGGGGGVAGYGAAGGGGQQQPQLVLLEDAGQLAEVEQVGGGRWAGAALSSTCRATAGGVQLVSYGAFPGPFVDWPPCPYHPRCPSFP